MQTLSIHMCLVAAILDNKNIEPSYQRGTSRWTALSWRIFASRCPIANDNGNAAAADSASRNGRAQGTTYHLLGVHYVRGTVRILSRASLT